MWVTETFVQPGANADNTGRRWAGVDCPDLPINGDAEMDWLADALAGRARAVLWCAPRGLVAPLSYRRHAGFDAVCAEFAAAGWPIRLRRSGGGVVPQGPGVLNLSLTYCPGGAPGSCADVVYSHLCAVLAQALGWLGIKAYARAVHGSFCDGRFNLAVKTNDGERKVVGTAQYWRRAGDRHAVLAHALLLFDAAPELLTERANAFEAALRSGRHYDAEAVTTVAQAWRAAHGGLAPSSDLAVQLRNAITAALAV
jgi:lipoate-protein ligase A